MIGHPIEVDEEVAAFHRQAFVFDLHNDLLTKLSHASFDFGKRHAPAAFWNPLRLDIDLPKLRAGGIDALGCLMFAGFRIGAPRRFWRMIDEARTLVERHAQDLALVSDAGQLRAAPASGRVGLLLGVEGSYVVEEDLATSLPRLQAAGVRFLGPLWERDSRSGSSCRSRDDRGLTPLGRELVAGCEAHGILLDVAHASRKTFWDIAGAARGPIFSSHSGADAVSAHPRNLDDDQIRAIADRGGVVGVIFVSSYVGGTLGATIEHVADHIEHVAKVGGDDVVALGSDFDGFMPLVRGMRDAADLPRLTQVLWTRGWRPERLEKLLGTNALRLF